MLKENSGKDFETYHSLVTITLAPHVSLEYLLQGMMTNPAFGANILTYLRTCKENELRENQFLCMTQTQQ